MKSLTYSLWADYLTLIIDKATQICYKEYDQN